MFLIPVFLLQNLDLAESMTQSVEHRQIEFKFGFACFSLESFTLTAELISKIKSIVSSKLNFNSVSPNFTFLEMHPW